MRYLILIALMLTSPAWAIYKCTVDGKTSFQEQPCAAGNKQTEIAVNAPPPMSAAGDTRVQDAAAGLEKERLRHEAEYALRDKQNDLDNMQQRCARVVAAISANRDGFNNNLAGATRAQAEAQAAQAQATSCNTAVQALQAQVDTLQRRCDTMGCKAPL